MSRTPGSRRGTRASSSLLTGAGFLAGGRYVVAALGWAGTAIIARELTRDAFGAFTTIFSLLGLVGLLSELRMSRLVLAAVVDADDDEAGRVVGTYVALRILVGIAGYGVSMGAVLLLHYPSSVVRGTALGGTVLVVMSAWYALTLLYQARMWHRGVAMSQVVGQVFQLATTVTIAVVGIGTTVWFTLPAVVNAIVGFCWVALALRGVVRIRLSIDLASWWAWVKEAAPLSLGYALETIYFRIDVLMLSLMAPLASVGLYGIGYKFSDLVGSLPTALLAPALTLMVAADDDHEAFHRTFRTTLVLLTVVGIGVGIGFAAFAEPAIRVLYGAKYTEAAGAARLLVAGQVLHFFTALAFTVFMAVGRNRLYPIAAMVGVVTNVGVNLVLIPRYGYNGSALATIITEVGVLAILAWGLATIPGVRPLPWAALARVAVVGALLGAALWLAHPVVPWPLLAVLAAVLFFALLHVLQVDGPGGLRTLVRSARLGTAEPETERAPQGAGGGPRVAEPTADCGLDDGRAAPPTVSGGADDVPASGTRPAPRRLVALSPTALVSGAEIVLLRTLRAAIDAGWDVRCACPPGPLAERLAEAGIERAPLADLRLPPGSRVVGSTILLARSLGAVRGIRRVARDADVLLVNGMHVLPSLRLARPRAPVAWLVHDVVVRRDRLAFLRLGAPAVDLAIAVSDAAAGPLRERGLETVVVRNGTAWPVEPATPTASEGPYVVGCNAVLTPWKGQDVLLDAVARLGRRDVVVELLGSTLPKDGDYESALRTRAARAELRDRVRFLGHVDEPLDVMRHWDVAVCPSVDPEAVSLGVLEAMSIGVPVVGTDHGGIPEFLDGAGLLVPPADDASLADALGRLLDDPAARERCSRAGRAAIAGSLTIEHQQQLLLETLDALARRSPAARSPRAVVFAVPDFEPTVGGTTRQVANQARALAGRGHRVVVLTQRLDPAWPSTEQRLGLLVRRLPPSGRSGLRMKLLVASCALWLRRHRHEIGAVQVLMYPDLAVAAVLAGLADRTVMCWAGLGDASDTLGRDGGAMRGVAHSLRRRALRRVAHVALTPALDDELAAVGVDRDVTVIPTPVDLSRFRPPAPPERAAARTALGISPDEVVVVYTGHLRALKRVDLLVEAFARVAAQEPRVRLLLVGGSRADLHDERGSLRDQVEASGLADRVHFTGEVDDVVGCLHAADVFVLPSDREGLSNSLLEAMACGLAVVAPASAGGDQVLDRSCGVVPPTNAPDDLATALRELVDDPARRSALGASAAEVARRYDLGAVVDRYEALYRRLGADAPG